MSKPARQRALAGFEDDFHEAPPSSTTTADDCHVDTGQPTRCADVIPQRPDLRGKVVYIVDAHSLIYQVFHAMPDMSSPTGQPVGAVHGFTRDILELLQHKRPDYLFCAFDPPGGTFRHELYENYKVDRAAMPDDLRPQIASIRRMLHALGVPILECLNYEADDVLATVARVTSELGGTCYVVTGDKDCRQLITEQVKLYNIRKDEVFDSAALEQTWGIRPDQVVDFQALVGDPTDNVPGVPLIGPKLASQLLAQFDTLDNLLERATEVSGQKRRENLLGCREQAMLSRQLVRLDAFVPIEIDWSAGRVGGIDGQAALELCREFGFRQLADRIEQLNVREAPAAWKTNYQLIVNEADLHRLAAEMARQPRIALDTETTSRSPRRAELVGLSFSWCDGQAYYLPVRAPAGQPRLDWELVRRVLGPLLENPAIAKIGQNLKYDMIVLRSAGVRVAGARFDTMLADYLLDPGERKHDLDDLAKRYLNHQTTTLAQLIGTGRSQKPVAEVPLDQMTQYACEDADVTWRIAAILERRLEQEGLKELFETLEMPLLEVLVDLEYLGIRVDPQRLGELRQLLDERLAQVEQQIYEAAGCQFNIDSRNQLAELLFQKLALPVIKRTKTGPSTDAEVLLELSELHDLPARIVEYRELAKLKSTYVDALPELIHPETGRVHTSFNQVVAATGRLSSTEPNLQNIPIRSEIGREIRSAFLPGEPGWQLLAADYSQIELRVLAHYSEDPALQRAFREDRDIHAQVASEVYRVPLGEVTGALRRTAKVINFGVIYGQTPFGLAKVLGIDKAEAAQFISAYFAQYPGVDEFIEKTLAECREKGYVSTVLGRRRAVQGIRHPSLRGDSRQRNLPERIAINTVIQGSAADLIKQAMLRIHDRLQREESRARMLLQIHDELVFEVPSDELRTLATLVVEEMTGVGQLTVPLKVDVKAGANWADCEPWS